MNGTFKDFVFAKNRRSFIGVIEDDLYNFLKASPPTLPVGQRYAPVTSRTDLEPLLASIFLNGITAELPRLDYMHKRIGCFMTSILHDLAQAPGNDPSAEKTI